MQPATATRLLDQLRAEIAAPAAHPVFEVPAERYTSEAQLARERVLFARAPRIALPSSALAAGACVPHDAGGEALVLARDPAGTARAFANACRHRGTRLVDAPCAKAIVCPYHGWTYGLDGALRHVPHEGAFAGLELATRGLREAPAAERHGLVWTGTREIAAYLGELDGDLAALRLDRHVAWRTARAVRRCNWKLVIEAFLDGYHLRVLHRDSIYRFFIDAASVAERAGDHVRALTARRTLRDGAAAAGDVRAVATPSFILFPATTIIVHPDFVSIITVHPLAPDATEYGHVMLVPAERAGETEHWDKSWQLIEETVVAREDLWACEQIQRGLATGRVDALAFGALEHAVRWFHDAIERGIAAAAAQA
jgi:phenylpropionate dioxygenase-like ring-hydroxylating dioxygenase large terminal subunit